MPDKKNKTELNETESVTSATETGIDELAPVSRAEYDRVTDELAAAKSAAEKQAARAEEMTMAAQRLQADFDNFRKRNADSLGRAVTDGESNVILKLLPALDAFEQALAMIADPAVAEGVDMIRRKIAETLAGFDVEQIVSLGEEFDPEYHNALTRVDVEDEAMSGRVVEVLQQGYRRGDKILRHALVKVAN